MGSLKSFDNKCIKLDVLQKKFGFNTMVETGCFKGETLEYVIHFDFLQKIYSCDIEPLFSEYCQKKFRNNSKVEIYNQNSHDFLSAILPRLDDSHSVLFWLDAHFYKQYIPQYNDIDYPLLKELEIISTARKDRKDIIIIDDIYTYVEKPKNYKSSFNIETVGLESIKKYGYKIKFYSKDKGYLLLLPN